MPETSPFSEEFEQQVRDCLAHLYDFAALQNDPVAQQLAPQTSGVQRVQAVRQIMIDAIENLNLNKTSDLQSKQGRVYSLLFLRYVEEQSTQEVLQQLALSERQFYREHKRAIQALSQMLWERIMSQQAELPAQSITLRTEVQRAYSSSDHIFVDIGELFTGVVTAVRSLAEQYRVTMTFEINEYTEVYTHRLMLRQTVIWLVSQLIPHSAEDGTLHLRYELLEQQPMLIFDLTAPLTAAALQELLEQHDTFNHLTQTLQAKVSYRVGKRFVVYLTLPLNQRTVLVIDDNPDVVSLIRRYLAHLPFTILSAQNPDEGIENARELKPHVIILDVMLPGKDGWEVLQTLKNHPATKHIPIFICSVLDSPDLALSLGADGFLKKPPEQNEMLAVLRQWVL